MEEYAGIPGDDAMNLNTSTTRKKYYDIQVETLKKTGKTYSVPYKSNTQYTDLPVFEFPIDEDFKTGLRFNLDNTRIIQYVLAEKQKGRNLDPEKPETQEFINDILLTDELYSKDATKNLKDNLQHSGQREPIIISCDGTIWNGNRRVSVMRRQYKKTGDPKWAKVKGVVLPPLSKKNLKRLEHRLQVARTYKEDYDPITLLLDCRKRHREEGWTLEELEDSFNKRYKVNRIKNFIKQIDLIDTYLIRIGKEGNYPILGKKGAEFFGNVQAHLEKERKMIGTSDVELEKITTEFFVAHSDSKSTYRDARHLSAVLLDERARAAYLENSLIYNNYKEYTLPNEDGQEKAFSRDVASDVVNKIKHAYVDLVASSADTPLDVVVKALKKLDEIKVEDIERGDDIFLEKIDEIKLRLEHLREYAQDV